ncbi:hypothetical protein M413DRAFT_64204 [Hebeloma cylindrosporum]|uniref:RNA-binding S4 domain-containing protein n=1 Tax=Hebeloma cylindrosporum TaxID=76867 RepID=A0A0C3CTE6_HEBCY|nr:hypothetical protein M413DRAFT_64204 [Hebeloma cylindrosporum h7]
MRNKNVLNLRRSLPCMSWSPKNLYNLWKRTVGPKSNELTFKLTTQETLFQQRWKSKAAVRAYHGDFIPEKSFKRWYLPDNIPDVRPRRAVFSGGDRVDLEEYARRKLRARQQERELEGEIGEKGMAPVGSLMFGEVERRLDVFLFRCCFVHSVYEARRLIIHGYVKLNGVKHGKAFTRLAPGDMVSVDPGAMRFFKRPTGVFDAPNGGELHKPKPKAITNANRDRITPFFLPQYASPWLYIPAYIEVSFATCSAVYVRHPTARPGYSEIPTPYDADGAVIRFAWEWYVQRKPRMRSQSQLARAPEDRVVTLMQSLHKDRRRLPGGFGLVQRQKKVKGVVPPPEVPPHMEASALPAA